MVLREPAEVRHIDRHGLDMSRQSSVPRPGFKVRLTENKPMMTLRPVNAEYAVFM